MRSLLRTQLPARRSVLLVVLVLLWRGLPLVLLLVPDLAEVQRRSACRCRGCCWARSSTRRWSLLGWLYVGRPSATSATSPSWSERAVTGDVTPGRRTGIVAVAWSRSRRWPSGPAACGSPAPRATSTSPRGRSPAAGTPSAIGGRVPVGRVVPRRRRADARLRRRHALVPGRLDRRLPRAARAGRRAAAPVRRVHAPRLRRGAARVARRARGLLAARRRRSAGSTCCRSSRAPG